MSVELVLTVAAPAALGYFGGMALGRRLGSETPGFFRLLPEEQGAAYGLVFTVVGALGGLGWSHEASMQRPETPVAVMTETAVLEEDGCRPRVVIP